MCCSRALWLEVFTASALVLYSIVPYIRASPPTGMPPLPVINRRRDQDGRVLAFDLLFEVASRIGPLVQSVHSRAQWDG
jgi:hypothetical protein